MVFAILLVCEYFFIQVIVEVDSQRFETLRFLESAKHFGNFEGRFKLAELWNVCCGDELEIIQT